MGVVERLGELAHQAHTLLKRELIRAGREERVEALSGLVEAVHERWAGLGLCVETGAVEAGVGETADELVLALAAGTASCSSAAALTVEPVDANPAASSRRRAGP